MLHYDRKVENNSMREAPLNRFVFRFFLKTSGHNISAKYASGTTHHPKIQPRDGGWWCL